MTFCEALKDATEFHGEASIVYFDNGAREWGCVIPAHDVGLDVACVIRATVDP